MLPIGTALITGASSGLGEQFAHLFAKDGWNLVLTARRRDRLVDLSNLLRERFNVECTVIAGDLSYTLTPERIFNIVSERNIDVSALVNNAGVGKLAPFAETDAKMLLEMMTVNMQSLVHLTRLFLPGMIARRAGAILNMGSLAGFFPGPEMAVYYASKAFVNSFSEALAVELRGTGVTVTVSCPGPTATEFGAVAGSNARRVTKRPSMPAEVVARQAYRAMHAGSAIAIPGFTNHVVYYAVRFIPRALARRLTGFLNRATKTN
jgi:uncharacterized protein